MVESKRFAETKEPKIGDTTSMLKNLAGGMSGWAG